MTTLGPSSVIIANTSLGETTPAFVPASDYRDQLRSIYIWPFVLVVIYTCFGILGNAIVLYIYAFKSKRTKSRIFILVLAVLNFMNSIFDMPLEAYILWHQLEFDYHWLCKTTRGVTFVINNVCACVFVAIAIDRILLVYKPLKRQILTDRYVKCSCLIAFLVGSATSWPGFIFYGTATLPEKIDGVIVIGKTCYVADEFLKSTKWPSLFNVLLFVLMLTVFLILTVLYIIIGRKIYQVTRDDSLEKKLREKQISSNKSILIPIKKLIEGSVLPGRRVSISESVSSDTERGDISRLPVIAESKTENRNFAQMSRRFSTTNLNASRGNTITMMLITIAFVVSFLPYLIIVSLRYVDKDFYFNLGKNTKIVYHVFLRTYFLNSVINPIIYSFVNKEFRQTLVKTLQKLWEKIRSVRGR